MEGGGMEHLPPEPSESRESWRILKEVLQRQESVTILMGRRKYDPNENVL
jgi:hypothetical protein